MLTKEELDKVVTAIRTAECSTSAEIRVCIAKSCKSDPFDAACRKFKQLKMDTTLQHNSVLLFVAPADHKTAIVADSGINSAATENFWDKVLQEMLVCFREKRLCEGICKGVERIGELIKALYPISGNNANELSDDVIVDENEN